MVQAAPIMAMLLARRGTMAMRLVDKIRKERVVKIGSREQVLDLPKSFLP
jgi:hypothetical protein